MKAYTKGKNFEDEFSDFLLRKLKWKKTRTRAHVAGNENPKGAEIDIIAERFTENGERRQELKRKFWWFPYLAGICLIVRIIWHKELGNAWYLFAIVLAGYYGVWYIYEKYFLMEHAWVECKNLDAKVDIQKVKKAIGEYEDYLRSGNKEYRIICLYFVSKNGFVENALKLAHDYKKIPVLCYMKDQGNFVEVKYWSEKKN